MEDEYKTKAHLIRELSELRQRIAELEVAEIENERSKKVLKKKTHDLRERVKELDCLYAISSLREKRGISFDEILQGTLELLPPSWQYPTITCARIILKDEEYKTENFKETKWKQASEILVHGESIGTVEVFYLVEKPESDEGPFMKEERRLINAIAERLGRITESKRAEEAIKKAYEELEKRVQDRTYNLRRLSSQLLKAQEEERRLIALELHDGIGQSLSAIKYRVESAIREIGEQNFTRIAESLESVTATLRGAVEEVRRIYMDLRPSMLDDLGLLATISWFCREFESIYSAVSIEKQIHIKENSVPDSLKIVIYRFLQEALNNMAKHSHANYVRLSLTQVDGNIELVIYDNGLGFDVEQALSMEQSDRGFGLSSMKDRIELSGGSFFIESQRGTGTTVRATWQC